MKKILLMIMLLLGSNWLFAQGGLTIVNNTQCGIWVKMLAVAPLSGDPVPCQLNSYTFLVPMSTTWTWCNVYDFQGFGPGCGMTGIGIYSPGWVSGSPIITSPVTTDFQWSDVSFQWDVCSDCRDGGNMSNSPACMSPLTNCWSAFPTWSSPPPSATATCTITHSAAWMPACLPALGNLTLTFN